MTTHMYLKGIGGMISRCFLLITALSYIDAVTLNGSSEYAVPGSEFTLTCEVPEEANIVTFYRRPDVSTPVGSIQVAGDQCYNTKASPAVLCTPDVCSCVTTSTGGRGTVFRWVLRPQSGDHGSEWFCGRTNFNLTDQIRQSPDYTLKIADAVTLTGSSEWAVPGSEFTLTCNVPEEANDVTFYRRPDLSTTVGVIQVAGDQCYNTKASPPVLCTPDVCSCVTTSTGGLGTVFRWVIQPQTGDHGSIWFCRRTNINLINISQDSPEYTLAIVDGPGESISLSPPDTVYTRNEGDRLPDITCTADCRPSCIFIWTKPDFTNFTASAVLSLGQLDRSEHGTYRCTARNDVGESSTAVVIAVLYRPYLVISPSSNPYIVEEGQTGVTFQCTATNTNPPVTSISWRTGTTTVSSTGIYNLTTISPRDAGVYVCSASNSIGTTTANLTLEVISMPRTPKIFGITKLSSSSLTLKWTPNDQDNSANTFTIAYSCVDCDVTDVMSVDVEGTGDTQFTTLTDLRTNTQYYINVTASNTAGSSVSAELTAVTAPGIINVCTASQDTVGPTSTAVIVVSAILIVAAVVCFGISVFVYRKARVLNRAAGQQGIVQKPVKFSDVLNPDTIPAHAEERSHYQDLDPKDIGKPSLYEGTTTAETNNAERGHYQELDPKDVGMQSSYEITARVNTDVDSDAARDQYESGQSTRHDYKNVTGKRDTKSTALYSNT
ncbi:basement membrane-specific heparan sulfate proteoglycan core protein-like isoform X2 [Mizuhopecten yessoensis]|uniref:basement membrane-specific heparan sulfate proteoglycan core protein-like isoform X2 n=1 Tax=Mizuhopecten yessoensis TaxID=6573 RepID=UPI000B45B9A3|nr:basement membrane-specific heparan sulfate proteoglycan core protein-like isoform X2 [Mizuhopecten yessoensis]